MNGWRARRSCDLGNHGYTGAADASGAIRRSGTDVSVAGDDPLVGGEVGGAHGAAGVELVGGDAEFGAQAVFTAVGETRRGVDHDAGAVDVGDKLVGGAGVGGQD